MTDAGDGWPRVPLQAIAREGKSAIAAGPFGSHLGQKDYVPAGVPVIRGTNLTAAQFVMTRFVYVTSDKADELIRSNAYPGDLVVTQRGTLGQVALIPLNSPFDRYVLSQSQMKVSVDTDKADPRFVYFALLAPDAQRRFQEDAIRSGVPHINLSMLRSFEIPIAPLPEQRAIAHVLRTVQRARETTEQVWAALSELRRSLMLHTFTQGLSRGGAVADYQETPWGEGPADWELRDGTSVVLSSKSGDWGSEVPSAGLTRTQVIRGTDFDAVGRGHLLGVPFRYLSEKRLASRKLRSGDLLVEMSGGSERQATGRLAFVSPALVEKDHPPVSFSNFVKRIDIADDVRPEYFKRHWDYLYMLGRTRSHERRTTGIRNFKLESFLNEEALLIPPDEVQKRVSASFDVVDRRIRAEEQRRDALDALFKSLLRDLITAKRRVSPDLVDEVAEVTA